LTLRTYRNSRAYAFYRDHGWVDEASLADWVYGREFVQLRRDL